MFEHVLYSVLALVVATGTVLVLLQCALEYSTILQPYRLRYGASLAGFCFCRVICVCPDGGSLAVRVCW